MSIRSDAKVLGISDSYLSRLLSGKRRWTPELYEKYLQLQLSHAMPQIGNFGSTFAAKPPILATKFLGPLLGQQIAGEATNDACTYQYNVTGCSSHEQ